MQRFLTAAIVFGLLALSACSRDDDVVVKADPKSSPSQASSGNATTREKQIAAMVDSIAEGKGGAIESMLESRPSLIKTKFDGAGPYNGWPLVMIAARNGHPQLTETLIKCGADVNETNGSHEVALYQAALHGHQRVVEVLLAHKADSNIKSDAGATALSAATGAGHTQIAELLREAGAKE